MRKVDVLFGDNQFLHVSHHGKNISDYRERYTTPTEIAQTLQTAWDCGIRDFAFTVTPQVVEAIKLLENTAPFNLHPAVPYAQYVNAKLSAKGYFGFILELLSAVGFWSVSKNLALFFIGRPEGIASMFIKVWLNDLPQERIRSVGLLNVVTDLFLGVRRLNFIEVFLNSTRKLGFDPILYTMNAGRLIDKIWSNERNSDVIIVANFNEKGFRMNPSKDDVIDAAKAYPNNKFYVMSVYSGIGKRNPSEIVRENPFIDGVIFGSSSPLRIAKNYSDLTTIDREG